MRLYEQKREGRFSLCTKDYARARDIALKLMFIASYKSLSMTDVKKIIKALTLNPDGTVSADTVQELVAYQRAMQGLEIPEPSVGIGNIRRAALSKQEEPTIDEDPRYAKLRTISVDFDAYQLSNPLKTLQKGVLVDLPKKEQKLLKERFTAIEAFIEWIGSDRKTLLISKEEALEYRNKIQKEPTAKGSTRSDVTVNSILSRLNTFFNFCINNSPINQVFVSPFDGVRWNGTKKETKNNSYQAFTKEEIEHLFSKSIYSKFAAKGDYYKYVPLVMLYIPMNPDEFCSLEMNDIYIESNVMMMHIRESKTNNRERKVPIPQVALDLGLREYILKRKKERKKDLFDIKDVGNGKAGYLSKEFNKFLDYNGYHAPKRLYSLRHTAIQAMLDKGVVDSVRHCIAGHDDDSTVQFNNYIKGSLKLDPTPARIKCYAHAIKCNDIYKLGYFDYQPQEDVMWQDINKN